MSSSFTNFLFQGSTPPAVTTSSNSQGSLPLWYSSYLSTLANNAGAIASTPYQAYPGQQIANLDPQQTQAYDYVGNNATQWQGPLAQAQGAAGSVAGGFNAGQLNDYMSPYISNVTGEINRLGMQQLDENLLPTLNSQFVGAGQFGSGRNATMDEQLTRDVGANITGQQGMAMQGALTQAENAYNTGQQNTNAGAANLGALAQTQEGLTSNTAGLLSASGQTMQNQNQQQLDLAYQNFQNQINYPRQNVAFLSDTLRGNQVPTTQDATATAPFTGAMGPSPLATFGGLALAGAGANTGTATPAARRGGYVNRFARGGLAAANDNVVVPMRRRGGLDLAHQLHPRQRPQTMGALDLMAA